MKLRDDALHLTAGAIVKAGAPRDGDRERRTSA
jgi:hypothetical protein